MSEHRVHNKHRITWGGRIHHLFQNRAIWLLFTFFVYFLVFFLSYLLAFLTRFEFFPEAKEWSDVFFGTLPLVLTVKFFVFYLQRHFRNRWFYASVKDLRKIVESSLISLLVFTFVDTFYLSLRLPFLPRSIVVIDFCVTVMLLGGVRLFWRFFQENVMASVDLGQLKRTFFIGANSRGGALAQAINTRRDTGYNIVGFLTVHPYKVRMQLGYIPILGTVEEIVELAKKHHVTDVLVIAGLLPGAEFRRVYAQCANAGLTLQVIPSNEFLPSSKIPIRSIDINDLLKRDPISLDTQILNEAFRGKRILVTGAGGSIGSEICRQLLAFEPSELILLGRGENRIFFLERELRVYAGVTRIRPIIADVTYWERIEEIFATHQPEVVFHAAAHKHVPLMEANLTEAVRNNIYGTRVVTDSAHRHNVERFVLISSDKAVNPTSVMGTTKHLAERYVCSMNGESPTKFITTRFGNVLGSAGSVVPIFRQQIENGGPITITDRRMTRFFMTIPEAAQLVLEAGAMGVGGEIFVLDMGEPVRIVELAEDMIRLAGLPPEAIEIRETGLRPGEKLFEELYFESEKRIPTRHPKLFGAEHRGVDRKTVQRQFQTLRMLLMAGKGDAEVRAKLREFVPEYRPDGELPR